MPTTIDLRKPLLVLLSILCLAACDRGVVEAPPTAGAPAEQFGAAVLAVLPPNVSPEMLEHGRELYATCSVCHGEDGVGTQLGPPFQGGSWIHINGEIHEIEQVIRSGVPNPAAYPVPMPVMGGGSFDDQEIQALATYVYVLSRESS